MENTLLMISLMKTLKHIRSRDMARDHLALLEVQQGQPQEVGIPILGRIAGELPGKTSREVGIPSLRAPMEASTLLLRG